MKDEKDVSPLQMNLALTPEKVGNPVYAEPVLGNPVSTLMDSGVGNCFPGLEFDLRQLDVRFFPGLVFEFLGVTPAGPDGTQGARLVYSDPAGDPIIADHFTPDGPAWVTDLKKQFAGPAGMSRTMLKSVSGDAADFMVMRPEPAGQPAHQFLGRGACPTRSLSGAVACRL